MTFGRRFIKCCPTSLAKTNTSIASRASPIAATQPFAHCDAPNTVWCVDFKGKFRTQDGEWCHVLTILDAYSRYVLRCEAVLDPTGDEVERIFDGAFLEFGLPQALRSDNGPPFASTGAGGLTKLSLWWLRLGINLERIEPGKPQQNGRHERMHRTLEEAVTPARANLRAQQRALDLWRREYNEERPHEALGQKPPATVYTRSTRRYPRPLKRPEMNTFAEPVRVDHGGHIRWRRERVFVSSPLALEHVELLPDETAQGRWRVSYGPILLGWVDPERLERGLILPPRRRRRRSPKVPQKSILSLDSTAMPPEPIVGPRGGRARKHE